MTKNIEALAKIGEETVLGKLKDSAGVLNYQFEFNEKHPNNYWKHNFRLGAFFYREKRKEATELGLDVSMYDLEFSKAITKYVELTGENDVEKLTRKEIRIREAIDEGESEEVIKNLREEEE